MTIKPNTVLGPYEVLSRLGAGGMGEVYLAKDNRLGRKVAIKVLLPIFAADAERIARFEQETKSLALLNHPAILQIYDTGLYKGSPYIVMEFLEGETLRQRLDGRPMPPRKAMEIACQVAKGLAAAHEKGITHRDLKPENIFLVEGDLVKILDFGLAKLQSQGLADSDATREMLEISPMITQPGMVVGTVGYLSPEQVVGNPADPRSDIFSFGVVLWEMLHGSRPFNRDSAVETMHAILKEEPPEFSEIAGISPGLMRIIHRCLEKNPKSRFQSAQDLAFNLEALSLGSATQITLKQPSAQPEKRSRLGWLLAVMVISAAFAGGIFWLGRATQKTTVVRFLRITYQRGVIQSARFGPDGMSYVYSVSHHGGPSELRVGRVDGIGTRTLGFPPGTMILSISKTGEMALLLDSGKGEPGMLARAPMGGGAPREVMGDVLSADWSPDGKDLAAVRKGEDGRLRLEYPLGHLLYTAPQAAEMYGPRVSPKGDRVAISVTSGAKTGELLAVDLEGGSRVLATGQCGTFVWSPGGDEVLFSAVLTDDRQELRAVTLRGRQRTLYSVLGSLSIHDITSAGKIIVDHSVGRSGTLIKGPEDKSERDLSWLHSSDAADLSRDGKSLLIGELHEGNGPGGAYLRKADGSEAVRLGDGDPLVLSPDSQWALVRSFDKTPELVMLPTGAGEPRRLPSHGVRADWALFLGDGARILVGGVDGEKHFNCYLQRMDTGELSRLPWEVSVDAFGAVAPDADRVALGPAAGRTQIYSVSRGLLNTIEGFLPQEILLQWSRDGNYLYTADASASPAKIYRIEITSGKRTLWKELAPEGVPGLSKIRYVSITPDGGTYAYSYSQILASDLYLMDGWK